MECPSCGRPVALARPRCLYCGGALPDEMLPQASPAASADAALAGRVAAEPARSAVPDAVAPVPALAHVVLDVSAADTDAVAGALALSRYEAAQRIRRGGLQLHRVLPEAAAAEEAARLRQAGLAVLVASAAQVQAAATPVLLIGGRLEPGGLHGRTEAGQLQLAAADLLLVVKGPIRREYQAQPGLRKVSTASLAEGYRFHFHRRSQPAPVELDPEGFEFDDATGAIASSLLRVAGWLGSAAVAVEVDDGFRFLSPALGAAQDPGHARLNAARALGKRLVESGRDGASRAQLDNLRQFRAYSAWRGAAQRLRPSR